MSISEQLRQQTAVQIERSLLAMRYVGFISILALMLLGSADWEPSDVLIIGAVIGLRILSVHIVLSSGLYRFFLSPLNAVF